eukprot:5769019-Alexandrium_andersonii.AAC.1
MDEGKERELSAASVVELCPAVERQIWLRAPRGNLVLRHLPEAHLEVILSKRVEPGIASHSSRPPPHPHRILVDICSSRGK